MQTQKALGRGVGLAMVSTALALIGAEMSELDQWSDVSPMFVGEMFLQLAPVVGAFYGGILAGIQAKP